MRMVIKQSDIEVTNALAELGLSKDILHEAIMEGEAARDICTPNDPPCTPGFDAWSKTVRGLREILIPKKWDRNDDNNFSTVVSPDKAFAIAVMTGDKGTGRIEFTPRTKYPKGVTTKRAVDKNQYSLFSLLPDYVEEEEDEPRFTWILLIRRKGDTVFAELSLPASMSENDHIENWNTRILLDPIEIDPTPAIQDDDESSEPPIVVNVRRRS